MDREVGTYKHKMAEAYSLSKYVERLKNTNDNKEVSRILWHMRDLAKSDNEMALDVLARINLTDFLDSNGQKKNRISWFDRKVGPILYIKRCVASNMSARDDTLDHIARDSLNELDRSIDRIIQYEIIKNPNTSIKTVNYIADNSRDGSVRDWAIEEIKARCISSLREDIERRRMRLERERELIEERIYNNDPKIILRGYILTLRRENNK
jgi:hypothetical protein